MVAAALAAQFSAAIADTSGSGGLVEDLTPVEAEAEAVKVAANAKKLAEEAAKAPTDKKSEIAGAAKIAAEKQKLAESEMAKAVKKMKAVTAAAAPKDIVDIVISKPIQISVKAATPVEVTTAEVKK